MLRIPDKLSLKCTNKSVFDTPNLTIKFHSP